MPDPLPPENSGITNSGSSNNGNPDLQPATDGPLRQNLSSGVDLGESLQDNSRGNEPSHTQGSSGDSTGDSTSSDSTQNSERNNFGLFQLMDAVFGRQSPDVQTPANESGTSPETPSLTINTDAAAAAAATTSADAQTTTGAGGINTAADPISTASVNIPGVTLSGGLSAVDNNGAIVITVNYMFIEGDDSGIPGRTGSLVVTLPNNTANREPRIILQFISLATRMAYSALMTNVPKVHPGVTLDKFNSFQVKDASELTDQVCPICFEAYDMPVEKAQVQLELSETVAAKKRKLGLGTHCVSALSLTERLVDPSVDSSSANASANEGVNAATGNLASTPGSRAASPLPTTASPGPRTASPGPRTASRTSREASPGPEGVPTSDHTEERAPKYLCQHNEEYGHLPVQMPCGHIFGQSCISHWLKENTSCPLCRVSVGENRPRPQVSPISYIRFGGMPNDDTPAQDAQPTQPTVNNNNDDVQSQPPLPARPLRPRNASISPVIDSILNYFGRARREREEREQEEAGTSPLFASGVSSRRTPTGVETVTSDANPLGPRPYNNARRFGSEINRANEPGNNESGNDESRNDDPRGNEPRGNEPRSDEARDDDTLRHEGSEDVNGSSGTGRED